MRLQDLIEELERQKPLKWDQKTDSSQLGMILAENQAKFQIDGRNNSFSITKSCHAQIAERLDIPIKYYSRMENEAPTLLAENVNTWLKAGPREFFVRGLGESVRALLSGNGVCPAWVGYFLASPIRKLIHSPHTILSSYVKEGMTVLDIGCGMGFFSIPLAKMVGNTGKVICVDMQEKMLKGLAKRVQKAGVSTRIETRLCSQDTIGLQDLAEKIDFALAFAVVHEVPDPASFFAELFATMVPSGRVLLAEPKGRVSEEEFTNTLSMAQEQGFTMMKTLQILRSRSVLLGKEKASKIA